MNKLLIVLLGLMLLTVQPSVSWAAPQDTASITFEQDTATGEEVISYEMSPPSVDQAPIINADGGFSIPAILAMLYGLYEILAHAIPTIKNYSVLNKVFGALKQLSDFLNMGKKKTG